MHLKLNMLSEAKGAAASVSITITALKLNIYGENLYGIYKKCLIILAGYAWLYRFSLFDGFRFSQKLLPRLQSAATQVWQKSIYVM